MSSNADADLTPLRAALDRAGYTEDALRRLDAVAEGLPPDLRRGARRLGLPDDSPLSTLVRLFRLGDAVPHHEARAALVGADLAHLEAEGLLRSSDGAVSASVRLDVLGESVVLADLPPVGSDSVMGVASTTRLLANVTPRLPVGAALDIGTGGGVQALGAARHARRVVGVDVNARALCYADLAARVNGLDNVEWRHGDLFEPVAGERFDLAVSNPPFAISPDDAYRFRDSGLRGDGLSAAVASGVAGVLEEGGHGCLVCNWAPEPGEAWWGPPARWLRASDCDLLIVRLGSCAPLEYAATWNAPHFGSDSPGHVSAVRRWLEHLRELRVESIVIGALVLRRRGGGGNWRFAATSWDGVPRPAGESVLRVFAAADRLTKDPLLEATCPVPAPGTRVERLSAFGPDGARDSWGVAASDGGLGFRRRIDDAAARFVLALDGEVPPAAAAAAAGSPGGSDALIEETRALMKLGLLDWRA